MAVDNSPDMLMHIKRAATVLADIETLDLPDRFDVVLMASHLINTPSHAQRQHLIHSASRHVNANGHVLIEWHPPEWFDGLAPGECKTGSIDGFDSALHVKDLNEALLTATVTYRLEGQAWRQDFQARRLTHEDLREALHQVGLRLNSTLTHDGRWLSARPLNSQIWRRI